MLNQNGSENDQQYMLTRNLTNFKQNRLSCFWGVISTNCPYSVECTNSTKSHNSCKICQNTIVVQYDQLHMVTNNPTKLEQILLSCFRGVVSTKCFYSVTCVNLKKSVNICKICWIKMAAQYDQHMVTSNPTKFEQNSLSGFQGVASTKCPYSIECTNLTKSNNSCETCQIKMVAQCDNFKWWLTIP